MKKNRSIILLITTILIFQISASSQFLPGLPKPSGEHKIGSFEFLLKDDSRAEIFTDDKDDKREILVRVWYPASEIAKGEKPLPLWGENTKEIASAIADFVKFPKQTAAFLSLVPSNSYKDAPLLESKEKFPVVVFSHGYVPGFLAQNSAQMEELASHGYVVFSVGHFYESITNVLPDGRIISYDKKTYGGIFAGNTNNALLYAKYAAAKTKEEKIALAKLIQKEHSQTKKSLEIWTKDMLFALDEIEKLKGKKSASIFADKLDMKKLGVLGMSFGGATAGQLCLTDKRCTAGISLDGFQFGDTIVEPLKKPFMFMQNENSSNGLNRDVYENVQSDAYFLVIDGAKHQNFTDFSILSAFDKNKSFLGKIEGDKMELIMNRYVMAFFDKYLKCKDSPLLKGSSEEFSEVDFSSRK